jgi:hypothetical protein
MATWEDARIDRLEERINRIERKEWERREAILRLMANGIFLASIIFLTVMITLAIVRHAAH